MLFFFNDTATTEIYTLSLHDALPIYDDRRTQAGQHPDQAQHREQPSEALDQPSGHHRGHRGPEREGGHRQPGLQRGQPDRKSTRLNSSHANISYAVFCLKKKKQSQPHPFSPSHYPYIPTTHIPLHTPHLTSFRSIVSSFI